MELNRCSQEKEYKCSFSLVLNTIRHKEMENTNLRLHLTPVRTATIQKTIANDSKDVEKQDPLLLARDYRRYGNQCGGFSES